MNNPKKSLRIKNWLTGKWSTVSVDRYDVEDMLRYLRGKLKVYEVTKTSNGQDLDILNNPSHALKMERCIEMILSIRFNIECVKKFYQI
jgi:hypothetical protein